MPPCPEKLAFLKKENLDTEAVGKRSHVKTGVEFGRRQSLANYYQELLVEEGKDSFPHPGFALLASNTMNMNICHFKPLSVW